MKNIFFFKRLSYCVRYSTILKCRSTKTIFYGSETIFSLGPNKFKNERMKYDNGLKTIVHIDYAKYTHKTLAFSKHIVICDTYVCNIYIYIYIGLEGLEETKI